MQNKPESSLPQLRDDVLRCFDAKQEKTTVDALRAFFKAANAEVNDGAWQFLRSRYQCGDRRTVTEVLDQAISKRESSEDKIYFSMENPG